MYNHCMFLDGFQSQEHIRRERRKAQELRKSLWWRQRIGLGVCHHCGGKFEKSQLTMDHLIPVARGGKTTKSNVVAACKGCNSEKGHVLPVERILMRMEQERSPDQTESGDA